MLANVPHYVGFQLTSIALLILALAVYVIITPLKEITMIRQGNTAAALSLGGTTIGMAIVLYSVAAATYDLVELAVWGAIGLAAQLLVFVAVTLLIPRLRQGLIEDKVAYGVVLGACSIAVGILSAGALTE